VLGDSGGDRKRRSWEGPRVIDHRFGGHFIFLEEKASWHYVLVSSGRLEAEVGQESGKSLEFDPPEDKLPTAGVCCACLVAFEHIVSN